MKKLGFLLLAIILIDAPNANAEDECLKAAELVQKGAALADGSKEEEGIYRQAITKCSGLVEAYYNLGVALVKQNRIDEAGRNFDKAITLNKTPVFMLGKADVLIKQGKADDAFELYNQVLEIDPKNDRAYQGLAVVYVKKGDYLGAESALRQGMQYNADEPSLYYNLGIVMEKLNRTEEAAVSFETAVEKNPRLIEAQIELAQSYIRLQRFADAERLLLGLSTKEASSANIHNLLGSVYLETNQLDRAKATLDAAIKKWPDNGNLHLNYALTLGLLGEDDLAMNSAKKAVELAPKSSGAHATMGWLFLRERKISEAKTELLKAIELDDRNVDALNNLGVLFELDGEKEQAKKYFSKALEIDPKQTKSQEGLKRLGE